MLLGPRRYEDTCASDQAPVVGPDAEILQPPSNAFKSNGLSQGNRSPLQTTKQSASLVQPKPDDTSLPRDHLNNRELQYEQCPPPTHPNFFELYDLELNHILQGNMLTSQTADESTSLVQPTTSNCASLPQNQSHNLGGQYAPLDPADHRLVFGHFESPQDW